jgi:hypothetical protein
MEMALNDLCEMRSWFPEPWYGMRTTVTSEGKCDVNFNYDPKCLEDPAFRDNLEF